MLAEPLLSDSRGSARVLHALIGLTDREHFVMRAAKIVGVSVLDHVIVTRDERCFHSMFERRTLPTIDGEGPSAAPAFSCAEERREMF